MAYSQFGQFVGTHNPPTPGIDNPPTPMATGMLQPPIGAGMPYGTNTMMGTSARHGSLEQVARGNNGDYLNSMSSTGSTPRNRSPRSPRRPEERRSASCQGRRRP